MKQPTILEQGNIKSPQDIMNLNIIDWSRWPGRQGNALQSISSWLVGRSSYTIIEHDLRETPQRSDWPRWKHTGTTHEQIGRLFWNDFYRAYPQGKLIFDDAPDFTGSFNVEGMCNFCGDIGYISAVSFAHVIKKMSIHDLWITLKGCNRQVIIEMGEDNAKNWARTFDGYMGKRDENPQAKKLAELLGLD